MATPPTHVPVTPAESVARSPLLRRMNLSLVLRLLRDMGPMSRAEIARRTGLTTPTVSVVTRQLMEAGYVVHVGEGLSTGGRRPILLAIREEARYVVGVDLGAATLRLVLVNLLGQRRAERVFPLVPQPPDPLLSWVVDAVRSLLTDCRVPHEAVLGVGVALHGMVDSRTGKSRFAPHFGWRDVPVADLLRQALGLPVAVDNDARMAALAEHLLGSARRADPLLVVNVGEGLGAGLLVHGRLVRGSGDAAGEIGHVTVDPAGPVCRCGKRGCLEALSSGYAIARRAQEQVEQGAHAPVLRGLLERHGRLTARLVHQAAEEGDPTAREVFQDAGHYLGVGLATAVHLLNPARVVLTGGVLQAARWILPAANEALRSRVLPGLFLQVEVGQLDAMAAATGAAARILEHFYRNPPVPDRPVLENAGESSGSPPSGVDPGPRVRASG